MHRGAKSRWNSSDPSSALDESGVFTPDVDAPRSHPDPASRALRTFLLALVAFLAINVSLNAALNPSGELRDDGLLLETVRASEGLQKVRALDQFIAGRAGAPMGVVLGSSRVMELSLGDSSAAIPYYNCGVSGAKTEDILAFARFILAHPDVHVAEAVIGVDPFALAVAGDSVEYGARLRGVHSLEQVMHERLGIRARMRWVAAALLGRDWTTALREIGDPPAPRWFDVAGMYPESNYVKRIGTTTASRARYLTRHISMVMTHLPPAPDADPRRVWDIGEAVRLLRANGARVTLFLPPTNPRLLAALKGEDVFRAQIGHARETLRAVAGRSGATFVDLTNPTSSGLNPSDFWDGYHYTHAASTLVVHALRAGGDSPGGPALDDRAALTAR